MNSVLPEPVSFEFDYLARNNESYEKELSLLNDLLADEELLTKKFKMLAQQAEDKEIQQKYERISEQHQGHFNTLYSYLK